MISILRNADPAKRRSKFKNRFVKKNIRLESFNGEIFNRPNIEKFSTRISILRNADPAKCRSKFKNRFVQKIFDWNPLKEKYSIDPILKSFQRGYRYRYYEMLTLLNVDLDFKRFVPKIID